MDSLPFIPRVPKAERIAVDGIFLLDKPIGITSNHALQKVKNLFKAKKAGHTGSLDPLASGLLPICLGKATKLAGSLLNSDKTYVVTAKFGQVTTTGDAEGQVIEQHPVPTLKPAVWDSLVAKFSGDIEQVPPMFSAIKSQGVPLYKLARQGKKVSIASRIVTIKELQLIAINADSLSFGVKCSKGTYIRSLVVDMGKYLQSGAYVTALRRTHAGPYSIEQARTLIQLYEQPPSQILHVLCK